MGSPLPRDEVAVQLQLAPGQTHELAAAAVMPAAPGRYELRAELSVVGEAPAVGGPWIVDVV